MAQHYLKEKVNKSIDKRREEIISIAQEIYSNPELGYKEHKTTNLALEQFKKLELEFVQFGNITGVKATLDTGKPGPGLAIFGELDAIICPEHPDSDKTTGAVHACGHNIQLAAMIGAAMGLVDSQAAAGLSGKIHFIAVPAEEYIEIPYRKELREKGIIRYLGGKPELLYRGFLDDVDLSMMIHAFPTNKKFISCSTWNGCLVKNINFLGKAAHAGGAPHEGINALYAANIALSAINSLRETFREQDFVRVHPIITKGGNVVNAIPSDVKVETFVRGKTMDSIIDTNRKVNRALIGSAIAMGAKVEIDDIPGYFPLFPDENMNSVSNNIMAELAGQDGIEYIAHTMASTDLGDLSTLMPVIHPCIGGVEGGLHSSIFRVKDPDISFILGAKYLANMVVELMSNNAENAKVIVEKHNPMFKSKNEYFEFVDKLFSKKTYSEEQLCI